MYSTHKVLAAVAVQGSRAHWHHMHKKLRAVKMILSLGNGTNLFFLHLPEQVIVCDISEQSPWWNKVRDKLTGSVHPHQAYLAALLSRGVHASLETRVQLAVEKEIRQARMAKNAEEKADAENLHGLEEKSDMEVIETSEDVEQDNGSTVEKKNKFPSLNDWEGLSMEMVEWNLVLWQLQSVMPISQLFSLKPKVPQFDVSVKVLLDKGRGLCFFYVKLIICNHLLYLEKKMCF